MAKRNATIAVGLVLLCLLASSAVCTLSVNADTNPSSTNDYEINPVLNMTSPNSNAIYNDSMPLNFTIDWSTNAILSWMNVQISYSIDNGSRVSVGSIQSLFRNGSFTDKTQSYTTINISNLTKGEHKIAVFADGTYLLNEDFVNSYNYSSEPTDFFVNATSTLPTLSPTPTSTASIPELSWFVIVLFLLSVFSVAVILRHRKIANLNQ